MNNKSTHPRTIQEVSACFIKSIVAKSNANVNSQEKKLGFRSLSRKCPEKLGRNSATKRLAVRYITVAR